ncbi:MAG: zinc ribbon domain-containing protein [Bacteroidetes bacterium]|jgi:putative FmdB family regulatory protein|nr:zinc ribbon domain-containing protein [Bacteroidota bacterium]
MPTYEYKREDGSTFEITQSINDDPLKTCPTTGQPVKRIISGGGGVVYKGTGWYVTDYKNNSQKNNGTATPKSETSDKSESKESSAKKDTKDSKE